MEMDQLQVKVTRYHEYLISRLSLFGSPCPINQPTWMNQPISVTKIASFISFLMDYFNTQSQQRHLPRYHNKKRLTQDQVRLLERTFTSNKKLDPELKLHLANQLGVPPRQVAIWYQNKRARWKTQNLALDYSTLQANLEEALGEKRRLEREVLQLHEELRKAHGILSALSPPLPSHHPTPPPPLSNASNCNSSCDDGGSSSLHNEDVNGHHEVLQLDELYACLIGGGSTWSQ